MFYAVECMTPTIYDWSTSLLSNMKHQLNECKAGRIRNFGFSSILSTFFFERVPRLSPRVDVPLHGVRDPAQRHWANAMRRLGGGRVANPYPAEFFPWWRRQIVAIEDYPYAGIDTWECIYFVLPCIWWWLSKPQFCIMTLCITTFLMYIKKFYGDRFIYLHV